MPAERNKTHHERALERLAREAQVPAGEVARLYESAHAELEAGARIKAFLGILALRKVRKILRQRAANSAPRRDLSTP